MSSPDDHAPAMSGLDEALQALKQDLPEMGEAATAFVSLMAAGSGLALEDGTWPPFSEVDAETFSQGIPLLTGSFGKEFEQIFLESAAVMLPALAKAFPSVKSQAMAVNAALEDSPGFAAGCIKAVLAQEEKNLDSLSEMVSVPAPALFFLLQEVARPCLRLAESRLGAMADNDLWFKGYCPVCGMRPDVGYLKEKDNTSEFLISKAGRLWLNCSMCGHQWRFMRVVCPSCGQEDHKRLEVLSSDAKPHERIHVCLDCKRYLPVMDLTSFGGPFNPAVAPLSLAYLDILAQEKGYRPMTSRPWNTFG